MKIDRELFEDSYLGALIELIEAEKEEAKQMKFIEGLTPIEEGDIVLNELTLFEKAIILAQIKEAKKSSKLKSDDYVLIKASKERGRVLKMLYKRSIEERLKEHSFLGQVFVRVDLKIVHKTEDVEPITDYSIFLEKE